MLTEVIPSYYFKFSLSRYMYHRMGISLYDSQIYAQVVLPASRWIDDHGPVVGVDLL